MRYVDFLILVTHAEGKRHLVFDNQLSFLKPGDSGADVLQFAAAHAVEVTDHSVVDGLLLHNQGVLSVGVKIEVFALETCHILGCQNNAQSFVATYCDEVAQRAVVEVEHIVRLVDDGKVPNLHIFIVDGLLVEQFINVVGF